MSDSEEGDSNKGWNTPGTKEELEEKIGNIPGAEQKPTKEGGTTTVLPGGVRVNVYPERDSTRKPGWKTGNKKGSIGD